MMGPMFIHGTSDYETYDGFFDYFKRKLSQCSSPPVLGSDDENAMWKAMKGAFLDSCMRASLEAECSQLPNR